MVWLIEARRCRIGRSGRFGRKGVAINFIADDEPSAARNLQDLERQFDKKMEQLPHNDLEKLKHTVEEHLRAIQSSK